MFSQQKVLLLSSFIGVRVFQISTTVVSYRWNYWKYQKLGDAGGRCCGSVMKQIAYNIHKWQEGGRRLPIMINKCFCMNKECKGGQKGGTEYELLKKWDSRQRLEYIWLHCGKWTWISGRIRFVDISFDIPVCVRVIFCKVENITLRGKGEGIICIAVVWLCQGAFVLDEIQQFSWLEVCLISVKWIHSVPICYMEMFSEQKILLLSFSLV